MNNPVHKIKRYVTYDDGREPHWTPDTISGWLATGVKDKKGVEIYEGNIVRYWIKQQPIISVVEFNAGEIILVDPSDNLVDRLVDRLLSAFYGDELEVIGHIAE